MSHIITITLEDDITKSDFEEFIAIIGSMPEVAYYTIEENDYEEK